MVSPPAFKEGTGAYYRPSEDTVYMPAKGHFDSAEEYYCVLFHEVTHATGHEKRLGRPGIVDPSFARSHSYSKEELVAEMGASFLCGVTGIENVTLDNSAAYIANWLKVLSNDPKCVVQAGAQAQRAADLILGRSFEASGVAKEETAAEA